MKITLTANKRRLLTPEMRAIIESCHGSASRDLSIVNVRPCYGGLLVFIERRGEIMGHRADEARVMFFAPDGAVRWDMIVASKL